MEKVISMVLKTSGVDPEVNFIVSIGLSILELNHETGENRVIEEWMYFLQPPSEKYVFDPEYKEECWSGSVNKAFLERWEFRPVNPWWVMHVIEDKIDKYIFDGISFVISFCDFIWYSKYCLRYGMQKHFSHQKKMIKHVKPTKSNLQPDRDEDPDHLATKYALSADYSHIYAKSFY